MVKYYGIFTTYFYIYLFHSYMYVVLFSVYVQYIIDLLVIYPLLSLSKSLRYSSVLAHLI